MVSFNENQREIVHVHEVSPTKLEVHPMRLGDMNKEVEIEGKEYWAREWNCSQCPETFLELFPKEKK